MTAVLAVAGVAAITFAALYAIKHAGPYRDGMWHE